MFKNIFSFDGRIRRTEYGLTYLGYVLISSMQDIWNQFSQTEFSDILYVIIMIPLIWVVLAQGAKRCHDRGNSAWYQIIPFYALWMLFGDSDHGPNQYGDNPKGIGNHDDIDEIGKQIENV